MRPNIFLILADIKYLYDILIVKEYSFFPYCNLSRQKG